MILKNKKILLLAAIWPEPASSASGKRVLDLLKMLSLSGAELVFASVTEPTYFSADIKCYLSSIHKIDLNSKSFDFWVKELAPEIVIFDRFMTEEQFGSRVAENCPNALRVLDSQDLHFLRAARAESYKKNLPDKISNIFTEIAFRELASIFRSDLILIISEFERDYLLQHFPIKAEQLFYLPLVYSAADLAVAKSSVSSFEEREDFLFIGNLKHEPNAAAVFYLRDKIWPEIKNIIPTAKLHIYGSYAPEKILSLQNAEIGFFVHGRATDSAAVFKAARVCIAPLPFGAGLKGKLLEAMMCGTPSVTNSIGAEGILAKASRNWPGQLADETTAIIEAAVSLYNNSENWLAAQELGFQLLERRFLQESFLPVFTETLQNYQEKLAELRRANFLGAMLQHHQFASTKYFSRWLELKNQKS